MLHRSGGGDQAVQGEVQRSGVERRGWERSGVVWSGVVWRGVEPSGGEGCGLWRGVERRTSLSDAPQTSVGRRASAHVTDSTSCKLRPDVSPHSACNSV